MVHFSQDFLFRNDVLNLLQANDLVLFEDLQREILLIRMPAQTDAPKGSCAQSIQELEFAQVGVLCVELPGSSVIVLRLEGHLGEETRWWLVAHFLVIFR